MIAREPGIKDMPEKRKILIIEDDLDAVEVTRIVLESKNYITVAAFNFEEGLAKAREEKPDLIILDVMMPGKSGFDLSYEIRKDKTLSHIPILMQTAVNVRMPGFFISNEADGEFLPVDEFIDKPAQPEQLAGKVEKLLAMKTSKWINWPEKKKEEGV